MTETGNKSCLMTFCSSPSHFQRPHATGIYTEVRCLWLHIRIVSLLRVQFLLQARKCIGMLPKVSHCQDMEISIQSLKTRKFLKCWYNILQPIGKWLLSLLHSLGIRIKGFNSSDILTSRLILRKNDDNKIYIHLFGLIRGCFNKRLH